MQAPSGAFGAADDKVPAGLIRSADRERAQAQRGWVIAGAVALALGGLVVFAVYRAAGRSVIAAAVAGVVMLVLLAVVMRGMLRQCNYSLACFLVGPRAKDVQPLRVLQDRELAVRVVAQSAPAYPRPAPAPAGPPPAIAVVASQYAQQARPPALLPPAQPPALLPPAQPPALMPPAQPYAALGNTAAPDGYLFQ